MARERRDGGVSKFEIQTMEAILYGDREETALRADGRDVWSHMDRVREIGRGTYGVVYLARRREDGKKVAVKELPRTRVNDVRALHAEITIMKSIRGHPNVLRMYGFYENHVRVQIVLDYCRGGEVFEAVVKRRGLTEAEARGICAQALSGIAHCHAHGVAHRDLKPQNLLLVDTVPHDQPITIQNARVVVADFGVSTLFRPHQRMRKLIGTVPYVRFHVVALVAY